MGALLLSKFQKTKPIMIPEQNTKSGRRFRDDREEQPRTVSFDSGIQDYGRYESPTLTSNSRQFVPRDIVGEMTHFAELIRGLNKDLNRINEEVRYLSDFKQESSINLLTLNNKLEHVVTDVALVTETMKFQDKIQNAKKEIEDNLNTRTKTTLMIVSAATGLIAIIISTLIQTLR